MAIPSSQLDTWANLGGTTASTQAYSRIQAVLTDPASRIQSKAPQIFLQGSYRNTTNIFGDSDVDVVLQFNGVYYFDITALTPPQQAHFHTSFPDSATTYLWPQWRDDVLATLIATFGSNSVKQGNKSIKVSFGAGRREADVVPVVQFRRYTHYTPNNFHYTPGVQLFDGSGHAIINYPALHTENGEAKNATHRTGGRYKETVRIFKNLRNCAVDRNLLARGIAPSYFVECLLYNVPDNRFAVGDRTHRIHGILTYLWKLSPTGLMCQNGQLALIGSGPTQWVQSSYITFVLAAIQLWDTW